MIQNNSTVDISEMSMEETRKLLHLHGPYSKIFNKEGKTDFGNLFTWVEYYWINTKFILDYEPFLYLLFYISVSVMGFFTEIAYCFHLFDLINHWDTL